MTALDRPYRRRPPRRRRRERISRAILAVVLLALAFLLGMATARTLDERPSPGDAVTTVRTLTPLPQQPPARTVTVTVTAP